MDNSPTKKTKKRNPKGRPSEKEKQKQSHFDL